MLFHDLSWTNVCFILLYIMSVSYIVFTCLFTLISPGHATVPRVNVAFANGAANEAMFLGGPAVDPNPYSTCILYMYNYTFMTVL